MAASKVKDSIVLETVSITPDLEKSTSNLTPSTPVKGWPTEAQDPSQARRSPAAIAYHAILVILPLGLLAKTVLVTVVGVGAWGTPVDDQPSALLYVVRFNEQLVTLFTIVFVTIIATAVRSYALWKAQKGATVLELEQLHSSINLPKTLGLIWELRVFSWTSLCLIFIWSWSYLGSQAVSRELAYHDSDRPRQIKFAYLNSSTQSIFEAEPSMLTSSRLEIMNAAFVYAVMNRKQRYSNTGDAQNYVTGFDQLGQMLLPYLDPSDTYGYHRHVEKGNWWDTHSASKMTYASDIGVQLSHTTVNPYCLERAQGNISNVPLNCKDLTHNLIGDTTLKTSYIQANCSLPYTDRNSTAFETVSSGVTTVFNMTEISNPPEVQIAHRYNETVIISTCKLFETGIEVKASCGPPGCVAQKTRLTRGLPLSSTLFQNANASREFLAQLQLSSGLPSANNDINLLGGYEFFSSYQSWLDDGNVDQNNLKAPDWSSLSDEEWYGGAASRYLSNLINAYMTVSQKAFANTTGPHLTLVSLAETTDNAYILEEMKGAPYKPQYRLNAIWLALDYVSGVILVVAAIWAVVLRNRTLAPDIFGYVSSMTRDNPMVQLPEGGSTLSGLERSRRLRRVKVQIADVRGTDGVSRVGFATVPSQSIPEADEGDNLDAPQIGRLQKGKAYV